MKTQRTLCFYRFLIVSCTLLFGSFFAFGQLTPLSLDGQKIKVYFETKTITLDEAKAYANGGTPVALNLYVEFPTTWPSMNGGDLFKVMTFSFSQFDYHIESGKCLMMANFVNLGSGPGGRFSSEAIATVLQAFNAPLANGVNPTYYSIDLNPGSYGFTSTIGNTLGFAEGNRVKVASVMFKLDPADPMGFTVKLGAFPGQASTRGFAIINLKSADGTKVYTNSDNGNKTDWCNNLSQIDFASGGITVLAGLGTLS